MLLNIDDLKPSIITPKIQAAQFELKPVMFTMLDFIGQFGGSPHEDARKHGKNVVKYCITWISTIMGRFMSKLPIKSMYEAWDRYKELFKKCPMHGFNDWMQVEI
ncbi:hypothetical protein GQ457_11G027270 [Hibiscus cannabinus]